MPQANMTDVTWRLMAAVLLISEVKNADIVMVRFMDESGYSFQYQIRNDSSYYEIDLNYKYRTKLEMLLRSIALNCDKLI